MVKEEPAKSVIKRLRNAGFTAGNTVGSHTKWAHPIGPKISIPDGHRTISPGVVRQVNNAITEAERMTELAEEMKGDEKVKREYKIEIERDGRWWMVHILELNGLTQARRLSEAELMAREWIAVTTDAPLSDITVDVIAINVPGMGNILRTADGLNHMRAEAAQAMKKTQDLAASFARELTAAGIPVRDSAELLDVSPQRISQLSTT